MDYDVVSVEGYATMSGALSDLKEIVNAWILDGWELQGGVSVVSFIYEDEELYSAAQAMVKQLVHPEPEEPKSPTVIQL